MEALHRIRALAEQAHDHLTGVSLRLWYTDRDLDDEGPTWWRKHAAWTLNRVAGRFEDVVALTHLAEQKGENANELTDSVARAFYVTKAAVALALGRRGSVHPKGDDYALAFWNEHTVYSDCGTGSGWTEIRVPAGFTNWVVDVTTESSI